MSRPAWTARPARSAWCSRPSTRPRAGTRKTRSSACSTPKTARTGAWARSATWSSRMAGLPSGTVIQNQAKIVFDYNDPINTPLVKNTLDAGTPTSQVDPLPATTTDTTFPVSWSGQDEASGSGIAGYDLYVSVDGGIVLPAPDRTRPTPRPTSPACPATPMPSTPSPATTSATSRARPPRRTPRRRSWSRPR